MRVSSSLFHRPIYYPDHDEIFGIITCITEEVIRTDAEYQTVRKSIDLADYKRTAWRYAIRLALNTRAQNYHNDLSIDIVRIIINDIGENQTHIYITCQRVHRVRLITRENKKLALYFLASETSVNLDQFSDAHLDFLYRELSQDLCRLVIRPPEFFEKARLPAAAPEEWGARDRGRKENPVAFIKRVYRDYLDVLQRSDLRRLDLRLYVALAQWEKRNGKTDDIRQTPDRSELLTAALKQQGIQEPADAYRLIPPAKRKDLAAIREADRLYKGARLRAVKKQNAAEPT